MVSRIAAQMARQAADAKAAARQLATTSSGARNAALDLAARLLENNSAAILRANSKDVAAAKAKGLSAAFVDRLSLDAKRIADMATSLREIAALRDPVGEIIAAWYRPNGMLVAKMRVPLGVILVIYESRPNVTADAAALCIKSGNGIVLRGGSEAINSNKAIYKLIARAMAKAGLPAKAVQFVTTTDRAAVAELLKLDKHIDVVMPRGGEQLIKAVVENTTIPVIKHYRGVCHVYIDESANVDMAEKIAFNAKTQRPGTCNAMETLLVNEKIASAILPRLSKKLIKAGVKLKVCGKSYALLKKSKILKNVERAKEQDFYTEWLDLVLSIKIVKNVDQAIAHITKYGTAHSDAIVTQDYARAWKFLREVDSAAVYANASTRLTDGYEFGLGAEMGVSTDKLHARGPVGIQELTTIKYVVFGSGQVRK